MELLSQESCVVGAMATLLYPDFSSPKNRWVKKLFAYGDHLSYKLCHYNKYVLNYLIKQTIAHFSGIPSK
jgi:hypothetical protein